MTRMESYDEGNFHSQRIKFMSPFADSLTFCIFAWIYCFIQ